MHPKFLTSLYRIQNDRKSAISYLDWPDISMTSSLWLMRKFWLQPVLLIPQQLSLVISVEVMVNTVAGIVDTAAEMTVISKEFADHIVGIPG